MSVHGATIAPIRGQFGANSFLIRKGEFWRSNGAPVWPNAVRFVTTPLTVSDYVYIGDIDIVVLGPDILGRHLKHMSRTGLPFSNAIRTGSKRLTGLHFTRYDALYPLPEHADLNDRLDEMMLTTLVRRKIGEFPSSIRRFRPLHGIHVSPNRPPQSEFHGKHRDRTTVRVKGWDWDADKYIPLWRKFRVTEMFKQMEPHLSTRLAKTAIQLDEFEPLRMENHKRPAEGSPRSGQTVAQIGEFEAADWL
jgi:hypothetical protein